MLACAEKKRSVDIPENQTAKKKKKNSGRASSLVSFYVFSSRIFVQGTDLDLGAVFDFKKNIYIYLQRGTSYRGGAWLLKERSYLRKH